MSEIYLTAGGDKRYVSLARELSLEKKVYAAGFEKEYFEGSRVICLDSPENMKEKADVLILPMPVSDDGESVRTPLYTRRLLFSDITEHLSENCHVFGGMVTKSVKEHFKNAGLTITDYLQREELAVLNAEATAEGAVEIALRELDDVLLNTKVLITGMGRIGSILARQLNGFGADIQVSARKYQAIAWAEIYGGKGVLLSELEASGVLRETRLIFNTVPALIFDEKLLSLCRKDCLIIDLASKPGGVDTDAAAALGIKTVWALGLPGKTAPAAAGRIIKDTVQNILREKTV